MIRHNSCGWEECKTESELEKLTLKMPNRYQLDSNGSWRCPPGEEFAVEWGLYYRVCSGKEINWKKQRNIYFLEDYLSVNLEIPTQDTVEIIKTISKTPGIKLSELIERDINTDYIYKLIADQTIYVDLESHSLCSESSRVSVFINKETAAAWTTDKKNNIYSPRQFLELTQIGKSGIWDGQIWQVVNVGNKTVTLLSESSKIIQLNADEFKKLIDKQDFKAIDLTDNLADDISSYLKMHRLMI
ncbi:MAG: hypothetical protein HC874_31050 [Richelia sp. SL_2_1]|nr:hypothetical protein [Richelia sp. SL_2_1]